MDLNKIRKMTDQETGQLENPVRMREVRRDIARVKTIMREVEQGRNA